MFTLPLRMVNAATMLGVLLVALSAREASANSLVIVNRSIAQDQGDWRVDYQIRHDGMTGLVLAAEEIRARVDGWVSNSRAPGHAVPRRASFTISGASGREAVAEVIEAPDDDTRCRERGVLWVWTDASEAPGNGRGTTEEAQPILSVAPGATLHVRLRLEHRHVVYGDYDPLLGVRTLDLWLGALTLRDLLPLDVEQIHAQAPRVSFEAPEDLRDTHYYTSAPDSLHLAAHLPGNQSIRFPDIPVRYGTRMKLRFRYLVAVGTQGECLARVGQYKDTPVAWKALSGGRLEVPLTAVGRWTTVERTLWTETNATTLALDFVMLCSDVGEVWIDDVSLEPLDSPLPGP